MGRKNRAKDKAARSVPQIGKQPECSNGVPSTVALHTKPFPWVSAGPKGRLNSAALKAAAKKKRKNDKRRKRRYAGKSCGPISVALPANEQSSHQTDPTHWPTIRASVAKAQLGPSLVPTRAAFPEHDRERTSEEASPSHSEPRHHRNKELEASQPRCSYDRRRLSNDLLVADRPAESTEPHGLFHTKQPRLSHGVSSAAQQLAEDRKCLMQAKELSRNGARTARVHSLRMQSTCCTSSSNSRSHKPELPVVTRYRMGGEIVAITNQVIDNVVAPESSPNRNGDGRMSKIDQPSAELFFVDILGDAKLSSREAVHLPRPLAHDQSILGNPYRDQVPRARHLVSGLELSGEQEVLLRLIMDGHNVFYTGSAGSGKSHVLRAFHAELVHEGKRVGKIGPTGISAINIEGETIYSLAGWTPRIKKWPVEKLEHDARTGQRWKRLNEIDVLFIDEISMVDSPHFSRLDRIFRAARQPQPPIRDDGTRDYNAQVAWTDSDPYGGDNDRSPHDSRLPFGGCQIIVCVHPDMQGAVLASSSAVTFEACTNLVHFTFSSGDFCQLPPVKPFATCFPCGKETQSTNPKEGPWTCRPCGLTFHFEDCWAFKNPAWKSCGFRNVRLREVHRQSDPEFVAALQGLRTPALSTEQFHTFLRCIDRPVQDAISLHPTNEAADAVNAAKLRCIEGPAHNYSGVDDFTWNEVDLDHKKHGARGSGLRINALKDHRLSGFLQVKIGMPIMLLAGGPQDTRLVNGSQGRVVGFEYYDYNRPSASQSTVPSPIPPAHDEYAEYRGDLICDWFSKTRTNMLPIVEFSNGQRHLIYPSCEIEEIGDEVPYTLLSRTQLPIKPAWAFTIHKVQGLSLGLVEVDLDQVRTIEMVYVALSRATSLEGLRIKTKNGLSVLKPNSRLGSWSPAIMAFLKECFG